MSAKNSPGKLSIFRSHSFYVKIVTTLVGLLILTVTPIILYNYHEDKRIVLELADDSMHQITRTVIGQTSNYFVPASLLVEISARLAELGALSPANNKQIERFTLGVLQSYPQISMFFLGDEQGNYIRAWRLPDGTMEGRIIDRISSPPTNTFKYWDSKFQVYKTQKGSFIDYDPRVRPWYVGAQKAKGNYWTDPYILFRNKKPGITSAYPVTDKNGKITGVWGVDMELAEISTFLKGLKIGKQGIAFIIDQKNEVVAYPDVSRIVKEENGKLRPVRVEELGVAPITAAFREYLQTGSRKSLIQINGTRYLASFAAFPQSFPALWKVGLVVPEDDFVGDATKLMHKTVLLCLVFLVGAILLAILLSRGISQPIKLLAAETKKIKDFRLEDKIEIRSYIKEIQLMSNAIAAMKSGLQAFRRYVPAELVRQLINTGEEARLGGQQRELTVFFSDIAGFTTIAERLTAAELMLHLSEYFDELTQILSRHQGTVDKYIGDGIMAFWGAPLPDDDHAFHACDAALACQETLRELNQRWEREGQRPFATRIGLSTGATVVGNVGSSDRINYTVMGDNVNLASRLEGINKLYQTNIIVSGATYEKVADRFWFRPLGIVAVKGKREGTTIYELRARKFEAGSEATAELCEAFTRGFTAYLARNWQGACDLFASLARKFPSDTPTELYLARCRQYRDTPPGPDWQGIDYLQTK